MPTGQIIPAGWRDPLATPQDYLAIPLGEFGEPDRNRLFCDLAPWVKVQKDAEREWKRRLYEHGQRHYKSAFNPATAGEDDFLMTLAGPKPRPPSKAIERAMGGDKAMLGLVPLSKEDRVLLGKETEEDLGFASAPTAAEPNPALPPVPKVRVAKPLTYPRFVRMMKREGITDPKEVAAHWKGYKQELVAETVAPDADKGEPNV